MTITIHKAAQKVIEIPPPPGLHATLEGTNLVVDVNTGIPAAGCTPAFLAVSFQNTRGDHEIGAHDVNLAQPGRQHFVLRVPRYFSAPPDVVRAYTATKQGASSRGASVAVDR